jgi:integrase
LSHSSATPGRWPWEASLKQNWIRPSVKDLMRSARGGALPGLSRNQRNSRISKGRRADRRVRLFEATELRRIIKAADPIMRAMVLLGIDCGFGNTDVSSLPQTAVDLKGGWIRFPRPKTAIQRRVPIWPETVAALRTAITNRPAHIDPADADLCFITPRGTRYVRVQESKRTSGRYVAINVPTRRFELLIKRLGINGRRGRGCYALRHVFETIAGESRDQVCVNAIMGHVDASMAGQYRERISDERLHTVVNCVRSWLFPKRKPTR